MLVLVLVLALALALVVLLVLVLLVLVLLQGMVVTTVSDMLLRLIVLGIGVSLLWETSQVPGLHDKK